MKGTVGVVALDSDGKMASATSTGGLHVQLAGRIGDTPMPSCGTYSNSKAAVSATGVGEAIIKTTLTLRYTEFMEHGKNISQAVGNALKFLKKETNQTAGLIAINNKGNTSADFNSDQMVWTERKNF
jgi:beta-aspartyl-peptidase (threonine type)